MRPDYNNMLPRILPYCFPNEEEEACERAARALGTLASHLRNFHSALALYQVCKWQLSEARAERIKEQSNDVASVKPWDKFLEIAPDYVAWQMIAARDGAMQIFHFSDALWSISSALQRCPTLRTYVDFNELRLAEKLFNSRFPHHEEVRHTIAHTAYFADKHKEHAAKNVNIPGAIGTGENIAVMLSDEVMA